jgi:AcrR family transcriptional regulator
MASGVKRNIADPYPRRAAKARATRIRVLNAARDLFIERGYVATTIGSIAERADVSQETIYVRFGGKRALLAELVDVSIAGDIDNPALLEQGWVQQMRQEPDAHSRLRILTAHGRAILERRADVDAVVRGAASADPEIAALRDRGDEQRFAGQRELLQIVLAGTGVQEGLGLDAAADALYAIGSPDVYRSLVVDRNWDPERFERWYGDTLERLFLEPKMPR